TVSNMSTGLSTGGTTNPFNLNEDYGPDDNDRRHNLVVDASYLMPRLDVQVAGIATYRSALPYSVTTSLLVGTRPFSQRPEPRNDRRATRRAAWTFGSARSSVSAAGIPPRYSGRCSTCSTPITGCATRGACSPRSSACR